MSKVKQEYAEPVPYWTQPTRPAQQTVQNAEDEPKFAEPVPYWAEPAAPARREPTTNARTAPPVVTWPDKFSERAALVQAAMDELRRVGAV